MAAPRPANPVSPRSARLNASRRFQTIHAAWTERKKIDKTYVLTDEDRLRHTSILETRWKPLVLGQETKNDFDNLAKFLAFGFLFDLTKTSEANEEVIKAAQNIYVFEQASNGDQSSPAKILNEGLQKLINYRSQNVPPEIENRLVNFDQLMSLQLEAQKDPTFNSELWLDLLLYFLLSTQAAKEDCQKTPYPDTAIWEHQKMAVYIAQTIAPGVIDCLELTKQRLLENQEVNEDARKWLQRQNDYFRNAVLVCHLDHALVRRNWKHASAGLAFSGGGIRSAFISLGFLAGSQPLPGDVAVSTVSGGGYAAAALAVHGQSGIRTLIKEMREERKFNPDYLRARYALGLTWSIALRLFLGVCFFTFWGCVFGEAIDLLEPKNQPKSGTQEENDKKTILASVATYYPVGLAGTVLVLGCVFWLHAIFKKPKDAAQKDQDPPPEPTKLLEPRSVNCKANFLAALAWGLSILTIFFISYGIICLQVWVRNHHDIKAVWGVAIGTVFTPILFIVICSPSKSTLVFLVFLGLFLSGILGNIAWAWLHAKGRAFSVLVWFSGVHMVKTCLQCWPFWCSTCGFNPRYETFINYIYINGLAEYFGLRKAPKLDRDFYWNSHVELNGWNGNDDYQHGYFFLPRGPSDTVKKTKYKLTCGKCWSEDSVPRPLKFYCAERPVPGKPLTYAKLETSINLSRVVGFSGAAVAPSMGPNFRWLDNSFIRLLMFILDLNMGGLLHVIKRRWFSLQAAHGQTWFLPSVRYLSAYVLALAYLASQVCGFIALRFGVQGAARDKLADQFGISAVSIFFGTLLLECLTHPWVPRFSVYRSTLAFVLNMPIDPNNTEYLMIGDGGHQENLGCLPLLAAKKATIVCLDNGADPEQDAKDLFSMLHLAIRMEMIRSYELVSDPSSVWRPAAAKSPFVSERLIVVRVSYGERKVGHIVYAKAAVTNTDLFNLKFSAMVMPPYPHQDTANQFYTHTEWEQYLALGNETAQVLEEFFASRPPRGWSPRGPVGGVSSPSPSAPSSPTSASRKQSPESAVIVPVVGERAVPVVSVQLDPKSEQE